jgi:hypothetical protein
MLLLLACSSSVLGMPLHIQQTHMLQQQQQQSSSSSSSIHSSCSLSKTLSQAAAEHISSSLTGSAKIRVTAVNLTGSCSTLWLLPAAGSGSHAGSTSAQPASTAVLMSSSSHAAYSSIYAAKGGGQLPADTPAGIVAASTARAAAAGLAQLHIDITVARDAPFFSDLVLQYSSSTILNSSTIAFGSTAHPSRWIETAGEFNKSERTMALQDSGAGQQLLVQPLLLQDQQQGEHSNAGSTDSSSSSSNKLAWLGSEDGLSAFIDSVSSLSQVKRECAVKTGGKHRAQAQKLTLRSRCDGMITMKKAYGGATRGSGVLCAAVHVCGSSQPPLTSTTCPLHFLLLQWGWVSCHT